MHNSKPWLDVWWQGTLNRNAVTKELPRCKLLIFTVKKSNVFVSHKRCCAWTIWFKTWYFNTLRPRQNGRHLADDMFKCIFLNEDVWIPIEISLKFVPKVQSTIINHCFRQWLGAVQETSHYLNQWWLVHWRIYASLGLNELRSYNPECTGKNCVTKLSHYEPKQQSSWGQHGAHLGPVGPRWAPWTLLSG